MDDMRSKVLEIIGQSVDDLNNFRPDDDPLEFNEDMVLFGRQSRIDSLDLVSVITAVEEALSDRFDVDISLTDDRALAHQPSPFDSVRNLADYIVETMSQEAY